MATARRDFDRATFDAGGDMLALMQDLTLLTLVGIVDPPRPTAKTAIATAHAAGRPGADDHRRPRGHRRSDREIDEIGVIARVPPEQKVLLVDILTRNGHVVGMTAHVEPLD